MTEYELSILQSILEKILMEMKREQIPDDDKIKRAIHDIFLYLDTYA